MFLKEDHFDYIFIGVIVLIGVIALLIIVMNRFYTKQIEHMADECTLKEYEQRYPHLVRHGKVYCYHCNTSNIYMKQIAFTYHYLIHSHICRHCGTELYRSKMQVR
ncbi:hypothetical protein [Sulfurospirillum halorespirans]|uniref:Uncharacterized protein n=1 Tax=Sulfurospirillum halorespirans DSM 13726 TaxID=1193502 RepID=A0A1D7TII7_9BACT|nr:hypothetical protein [Sulfurospirillum halorespirans]AOO64793.1 hypothetical protein SHALO_1013 [Sulfurospirillum halorespirans DSM 13726]